MSHSDEPWSPLARRRLLQLLGTGAGLGAAWKMGVVPASLDGWQSQAGTPPALAGKAIIRAVTADLDPATHAQQELLKRQRQRASRVLLKRRRRKSHQ